MNPLARLNAVESSEEPADEQNVNDEELRLFSNTTFFDLDMGRSTDIATTVDELLMQQEKQIQYPQKQQPFEYLNAVQNGTPHDQNNYDTKPYQFDMNTLQGFSMAEELPTSNLSIQDVDPMFRRSDYPRQGTGNQQQPVYNDPHQNYIKPEAQQQQNIPTQHNIQPQVQIQTQNQAYASPPEPRLPSPKEETVRSSNLDEDKRRRNTAASARFRVKKKQREQEMERNQKLMQKKIEDQEVRIKQLEMENEWLRKLALERTAARQTDSLDELRQKLLHKESL